MDVTWGSYHRRQEILREVVARVEHTGEVARPWSGVHGLALEFENDGEVLQELHHWWVRALVARLHVLELSTSTHTVYAEVAAAHAGLRAILDAYGDHPALAEGLRREREMLGAVAA